MNRIKLRKYLWIGFFFSLAIQCHSARRFTEPNPNLDLEKDRCLVIIGLVNLLEDVDIGTRKRLDYRALETGYLQFIEVFPEEESGSGPKEGGKGENGGKNEDDGNAFHEFRLGNVYTPNFETQYVDEQQNIDYVIDRTIDSNKIYFAFTGMKPGSYYTLYQIGFTRQETVRVSENQTISNPIPFFYKGNPESDFRKMKIHCQPKRASFLGIYDLEFGNHLKYKINGEILNKIAYLADDDTLEDFFGKYEPTKKGAAWYIKDILLEYQKDGYWNSILNP